MRYCTCSYLDSGIGCLLYTSHKNHRHRSVIRDIPLPESPSHSARTAWKMCIRDRCQHRPGQDPAHPGNSIFIPRRTVQNGLPISRSITFHCFFDCLSCKIFIKIPPCSTGFCKFSCEILQYRMIHISHIRHFKAKFFSLLQRQAILQEMCIRDSLCVSAPL